MAYRDVTNQGARSRMTHDEWMERDLKRMQRHGSRTVAVLEEADDGKVQERCSS